jgi:hypothetical protein
LDRHYTEGTNEKEIATAHEQDLAMQEEYDAKFLTYWHDEGRNTTFWTQTSDVQHQGCGLLRLRRLFQYCSNGLLENLW